MPWALVNALQGWGIEVVACAKGVCVRLWASSVYPFSGPGRLPATPGGALAVWRRSALVWPEAGFGVSGGLMRGALVRPKGGCTLMVHARSPVTALSLPCRHPLASIWVACLDFSAGQRWW